MIEQFMILGLIISEANRLRRTSSNSNVNWNLRFRGICSFLLTCRPVIIKEKRYKEDSYLKKECS